MIERVAITHWEGEMSWLRKRSLETFQEQNPKWSLEVVGTPKDIKKYGLTHAQAGDWTSWRMLRDYGGLVIDSDIVWTNPVPDGWLDCDICAQHKSSGNVYQMAAIGAARGNELFLECERYCESHAESVASQGVDPFDPDAGYQVFGVETLARIVKNNIGRFGRIARISHEDLCFYGWELGPRQVWGEKDPSQELPDSAIGVHWYGGSKESKKHEYAAHAGGPSWLERLASGGA